MLRFIFPLLAGLITVAFPVSARAGDAWDLCRAPSFIFSAPEITGSDETLVEAQTITQSGDNQLLLTGEVSVLQAQQRIQADEVKLEQEGQSILASGNVQFENQNYRMYSSSVSVDKINNRARFEQPRFQLNQHHGNGQAERIEQLDESRSQFRNLLYTTCDPDDRVWHLRASEMEIDDASGRGTAKHTTLYFKDVPFFYFPYFQFPIDDRRLSGILTPRIGYSDSQGGNLEVPVYWNIAANYDATITPAWFSERGTQLNTENRYLFEHNAGQLDLSYLDDDDIDDSRWFQRFRHDSNLGYDIKANLLLTEVSDEEFFDDFDNIAPEYNNLNHLDRHLRLSRQGERWHGEVLWQHYQTPDRSTSITSRPYNRLPRAAIDGQLDPWADNLDSHLSAEWVNFERDDSVTGQRGHLVSDMRWRASQSWYFLEPALQLNFTDYHLDNNTGDNSIDRAIPILSLDSGLIFERLIGTQNQWLQTLEPRLFLLSTPFEDQDDIPDFDTAVLSSTYDNLFRNNRFSGADRIGDAKQITFGLASRIFDNDSGDELFQFRTGRIFYLQDREVSLNGVTQEETRSDVITEIDIWPNDRTRISSLLVYDEEDSRLREKDLTVSYEDAGFAANLGYYFTEDDLEQGLISLAYPVNERWTVVAKYHQSLLFDKTVENLIGINYESCCWGIKILAGQTGDDDEDFAETDNSIYFEITLKGLSQAGDDIDSELNRAIPGYQSGF